MSHEEQWCHKPVVGLAPVNIANEEDEYKHEAREIKRFNLDQFCFKLAPLLSRVVLQLINLFESSLFDSVVFVIMFRNVNVFLNFSLSFFFSYFGSDGVSFLLFRCEEVCSTKPSIYRTVY